MQSQPNDRGTDLTALRVPPEGTSPAYVWAGGFAFGEPFDMLLRQLSEEYLRKAWDRLSSVLQRYPVPSDDLRWGWLHGGVTGIPGLTQPAPSDFTGWVSPQLDRFWQDSYYEQLDNDLAAASPVLRCACTYRAHYWQIAPDDFTTGLRLIEELWTEEPGEWSPSTVLLDQQRVLALNRRFGDAYGRGDRAEADRFWAEECAVRDSVSADYRLTESQGVNEPWRKVASALHARDRQKLRDALGEAQSVYSPVGYRVLLHGYANTMDGGVMLPLA